MKQIFAVMIEQPDDEEPVSAEYIRGRAFGFGRKPDSITNVTVEKASRNAKVLGVICEWDVLDVVLDLMRSDNYLIELAKEGYRVDKYKVAKNGGVSISLRKDTKPEPTLHATANFDMNEIWHIYGSNTVWVVDRNNVPKLLRIGPPGKPLEI